MSRSHGRRVFNFLRNCQTVFQSAWVPLHSYQPSMRWLPTLSNAWEGQFFSVRHGSGYVLVAHGGFNMHFLND